jgi:hypothetical protein
VLEPGPSLLRPTWPSPFSTASPQGGREKGAGCVCRGMEVEEPQDCWAWEKSAPSSSPRISRGSQIRPLVFSFSAKATGKRLLGNGGRGLPRDGAGSGSKRGVVKRGEWRVAAGDRKRIRVSAQARTGP